MTGTRPPVRVAFLVSTLTTGGAERELQHLVLEIDRTRIEPRVCTLRAPGPVGDELARKGVPVSSEIAPGRFPTPWLPFTLASRFRRDRIDCIYTLDHTNAVVAGVAAATLAGGLPVIMAVHTTSQWDRPSIPAPIRAVLGGIRRIVAVARVQRDYLVKSEHIRADKIVVIRNGIPLLDPATLPSQAEARTALGITPGDGPVIGIIAMLRPEKGHEVFLEAAERLVERMPGALFLVVGDGPRRGELEELARTLGVAGRVRFLGRRDDVPRILRALDLSVLSSHPRVETLPLSQMEAMSLEVPVVATRVGALEELVEDGVEGRLVPPGDPAALAEAIGELAADPTRLRAAGAAARRKILDEFTIERAARETENLILSVSGS